MTVYELIQKLQDMPQDLKVVMFGENIDDCHINYEYYDGDYANPNTPIIVVVELE